jgi:hypothetical protein
MVTLRRRHITPASAAVKRGGFFALAKSSRPRELPPQSLTEPYVRLSPHTVLHIPHKLLSLHKSKAPPVCSWLMIQTGHVSPFAPFPLQKLHHYYGLIRPCALHRYSDPPWGFHSDFSLNIRTTSSIIKPISKSSPLYAGCRLVSNKGNFQTYPRPTSALGF